MVYAAILSATIVLLSSSLSHGRAGLTETEAQCRNSLFRLFHSRAQRDRTIVSPGFDLFEVQTRYLSRCQNRLYRRMSQRGLVDIQREFTRLISLPDVESRTLALKTEYSFSHAEAVEIAKSLQGFAEGINQRVEHGMPAQPSGLAL